MRTLNNPGLVKLSSHLVSTLYGLIPSGMDLVDIGLCQLKPIKLVNVGCHLI